MLEHQSKERRDMSTAAQTLMREYAGLRWPSMNHKGRIARLAGVLGFTHRRTRSLYQNEPGARLRADELASIEALNRRIEEGNRNEFAILQSRVARLEAALLRQDEEFHSEQMAAFSAAVDGRRREDVTDAIGHEGEA